MWCELTGNQWNFAFLFVDSFMLAFAYYYIYSLGLAILRLDLFIRRYTENSVSFFWFMLRVKWKLLLLTFFAASKFSWRKSTRKSLTYRFSIFSFLHQQISKLFLPSSDVLSTFNLCFLPFCSFLLLMYTLYPFSVSRENINVNFSRFSVISCFHFTLLLKNIIFSLCFCCSSPSYASRSTNCYSDSLRLEVEEQKKRAKMFLFLDSSAQVLIQSLSSLMFKSKYFTINDYDLLIIFNPHLYLFRSEWVLL